MLEIKDGKSKIFLGMHNGLKCIFFNKITKDNSCLGISCIMTTYQLRLCKILARFFTRAVFVSIYLFMCAKKFF